MYITNKFKSIKLPYSQDLLEWLLVKYPKSEYYCVTEPSLEGMQQ
jgi:hypothetical protein